MKFLPHPQTVVTLVWEFFQIFPSIPLSHKNSPAPWEVPRASRTRKNLLLISPVRPIVIVRKMFRLKCTRAIFRAFPVKFFKIASEISSVYRRHRYTLARAPMCVERSHLYRSTSLAAARRFPSATYRPRRSHLLSIRRSVPHRGIHFSILRT